VVDDILDVTQESDTLGKTAGKDLRRQQADLCHRARPAGRAAPAQALRDAGTEALARSGLPQPALANWPTWWSSATTERPMSPNNFPLLSNHRQPADLRRCRAPS
jgi:hypothetical protein